MTRSERQAAREIAALDWLRLSRAVDEAIDAGEDVAAGVGPQYLVAMAALCALLDCGALIGAGDVPAEGGMTMTTEQIEAGRRWLDRMGAFRREHFVATQNDLAVFLDAYQAAAARELRAALDAIDPDWKHRKSLVAGPGVTSESRYWPSGPVAARVERAYAAFISATDPAPDAGTEEEEL